MSKNVLIDIIFLLNMSLFFGKRGVRDTKWIWVLGILSPPSRSSFPPFALSLPLNNLVVGLARNEFPYYKKKTFSKFNFYYLLIATYGGGKSQSCSENFEFFLTMILK